MTTQQKLTAAIDALGSAPDNHRNLYTNTSALRKLLTEITSQMIFRLGCNSGGSPLHPANATGTVLAECRGQVCQDFATISAMLEAVESSSEYRESVAAIEPLVAEVRRFESILAAEVEERGKLAGVVRDAEAKATAAALAKIETDPAVIAARKALAAVESGAP